MNPIISIILPVYNAEKTIMRMLDSILQQTFKQWELICIDDGSTDDSCKILDKYAQHDERIKVIHKENEGVATARQVGVDNASGVFSIHADSDDWVEPDMLQELYEVAKQDHADMVITDYYVNHSLYDSKPQTQMIIGYSSNDIMYSIITGELFGALWNKLIRTSCIKKANARFFKGVNYSEDVLFLAQILCNKDCKISYIPKSYYHYYMNPNSITKKMSLATYIGLKEYLYRMAEILPKDKRFQKIIETFPMALFTSGFLNGYIENKDIQRSFNEVRHIAYETNSMRWKIGYVCIELGLFKSARKLLKQ